MSRARFLEQHGPWILSVIATVILAMCVEKLTVKQNEEVVKDFSTFSLGVSTALIGFLLTVYTIIHSINTKRMILLRKNNVYSQLLSYLNSSIISHGVVIILALMTVIPYIKEHSLSISIKEMSFSIKPWIIYAYAAFFSIATSYRFISLFLFTLSDESNFSK